MDYFSHNLKDKLIFRRGAKVWLLEKAYTPKKKQLSVHFTEEMYLKNTSDYIHFQWINDQFECANPNCLSKKVQCIWYLYQPYDLGVDDTFAEFFCPDCGKYSFLEYNRNSS